MDECQKNFNDLLKRAKKHAPIRVAVVGAGHKLVIAGVEEAQKKGLIDPLLIGQPKAIQACLKASDLQVRPDAIVAAEDDAAAARVATQIVRAGEADAIMKGRIHTDDFMHALLHTTEGLRLPNQRASHLFAVEIARYHKLLAITDVAINISPDLKAKAEILENAIQAWQSLGIKRPKCAILSAIETVNPAIASTLDAACLVVMAQRGQIQDAIVDGPLAFDNAISADAAREKGIESEVSGDADIFLVPDLVSGNILAKNLQYLAGATSAGIVLGLRVPVVLTSRADPAESRLTALALATLVRSGRGAQGRQIQREYDSAIHCAAQLETACQPLGR